MRGLNKSLIMKKTHGKIQRRINRDHGGVIPPRGDDQPRSRNALFDAYCEIYRPLQGRRQAGSAASQAVDASSPNQSARADSETRETQWQFPQIAPHISSACSPSCPT